MSLRYVSLRALQRSHSIPSEELESHRQLRPEKQDGALLSSPAAARIDPEHVARVLGGTAKTKPYGEYFSVRSWCAQPPRYSPEPRALRLLVPDPIDEVSDPDQWLFLDTETTGLSGGSGTYACLVGI